MPARFGIEGKGVEGNGIERPDDKTLVDDADVMPSEMVNGRPRVNIHRGERLRCWLTVLYTRGNVLAFSPPPRTAPEDRSRTSAHMRAPRCDTATTTLDECLLSR